MAIPPPSAAEGGCRPLSEANTILLHNPRRSRAPSPSEPRAAAAPLHFHFKKNKMVGMKILQ